MDIFEEAQKIEKSEFSKGIIKIKNRIINIQNVNITQNNIEIASVEDESKVWISISNKLLENKLNNILGDYKTRTSLIDMIVNRVSVCVIKRNKTFYIYSEISSCLGFFVNITTFMFFGFFYCTHILQNLPYL